VRIESRLHRAAPEERIETKRIEARSPKSPPDEEEKARSNKSQPSVTAWESRASASDRLLDDSKNSSIVTGGAAGD